MPTPRLKGQEVNIQVVQDGVVQASIDSISSFNDTMKADLKEDGFLGETTNRYDEVFNGHSGGMEVHLTSQDWMVLRAAIKARMRRQQPTLVFNFVRTDFYANGDTPITTYPDVKFGSMPMQIGSRGDFVKVSFEFATEDIDESLETLL